ncbi:unnamed protein product [Rotaria socialis]|uniref:Uncharacterized protein n=1 Tax=Rotaria socialis TaxID=392032 RepID=A0A818R6I3_9BILA|nr:unnamed protein product [Rotaria socialis]CAF4213158.1 unnamed protein product [Rotaria socialis]
MRQDKLRSSIFATSSLFLIRSDLFFKCAPSIALQIPIFHLNIQNKYRFSKDEKQRPSKGGTFKVPKGNTPKQIYHDLNGGLGLRTIKRWYQMIRRSGTITLSKLPGGPRLA